MSGLTTQVQSLSSPRTRGIAVPLARPHEKANPRRAWLPQAAHPSAGQQVRDFDDRARATAPDKKSRLGPTEEQLAMWQRVIPIMNEILQHKGLVKIAEGKVYVNGLTGPLEDGWRKKVLRGHALCSQQRTRRATAVIRPALGVGGCAASSTPELGRWSLVDQERGAENDDMITDARVEILADRRVLGAAAHERGGPSRRRHHEPARHLPRQLCRRSRRGRFPDSGGHEARGGAWRGVAFEIDGYDARGARRGASSSRVAPLRSSGCRKCLMRATCPCFRGSRRQSLASSASNRSR